MTSRTIEINERQPQPLPVINAAAGTPGAGYFALAELKELNSGFYHDSRHALEVAELAKAVALSSGRSSRRAEFIKQVALIHDADLRVCRETGLARSGTPARVQVTLEWMEAQREHLEERFGWRGFQFHEACALIARTDFPFDRKPRRHGTRFDGLSPVDVYREFLWKLPFDVRAGVLADALLLRFSDQVAAYVGSFHRAEESVRDLHDELVNTGIPVELHEMYRGTPEFLARIGTDLYHDERLRTECNLENVELPGRSRLLRTLGWGRRIALFRNAVLFRFGLKNRVV